MTFQEIARLYADRLIKAQNVRQEAEKIYNEINGLTYQSNNYFLSAQDKREILRSVYRYIESINENVTLKDFDNSAHLAAVGNILNRM